MVSMEPTKVELSEKTIKELDKLSSQTGETRSEVLDKAVETLARYRETFSRLEKVYTENESLMNRLAN